uniref:Death domain-containing protein n=1 Tax=Branchiostoma floridae TaxID=7739 RepID=C3YCJ7_BRAFL|eukprot:XP_002606024.1 hypothetical protein BRAFLDRAFT_100932 [Branchiostoma floridae]
MAATRNSAGDKARKTYETTDNLVGRSRRSLLASHTRQTINNELNLSFLLPIHATASSAARDVFQQDAPKGSLPARHVTVSFLGDARAGDARAGKTSLEKHLLDKSFDSVEEATKGLEFDVVQTDVTEINEAWQTVPERPYSRYDTGRAQYVVKEILEEAVPLANQPLFRRPVLTTLSNFALTFAVIFMILSGPVGFQLGLGVFFLLTMGIFKMFGQSYNAAMYSLIMTAGHVVLNYLIRDIGLLNIFSAFGNEQSTAYPYLQYVMFVLTMILIAFVVVLPSHPSGLPCMALAFCLMCSPAQLHSENFPSTLHLALTGPICLGAAATYCGVVASFLRCLAPTSLMLLLTAWYLTEFAVSSKETLEYVLSLIAGFILGAMFEVTGRTMQPTLDAAQPTKTGESSNTSEQKSVSALLDPSTIQHLSILLDPPAPIFGNNWRALADELGLCFQDICYIETKPNPTEMALEMYRKNTPTANTEQVHRALLDIDRPDAAELFQPTSVESQGTTQ